MAVGGKEPQRNDRQRRADRTARKDAASPALPETATAQNPRQKLAQAAKPQAPFPEPAPQRRSGDDRRDQVPQSSGKAFSREETLEWIANARKQVLAARGDTVKAAEARIADLEAALEVALTRVAFLENENQSLETSIDLAAGDNLSLGRRLAESETRSSEARAALQNSAVLRAEYEGVISTAERRIEILQNLIAVKEARLHKLEQTRTEMEQGTRKLLEAANARDKARDQALADAEQRIVALTGLFEKLELSLEGEKGQNDNQIPGTRSPERKPRASERTAPPKAEPELRLWRRELDTDDWLLHRPARQTA
jgi:hypothetical protein